MKKLHLIVILSLCFITPALAQTIKVGFITPLSGINADFGEKARRGVALIADKLQSEFYNSSKKIEVVIEDSQGDAAKSIASYQKLKLDGIKIIITQNSTVSIPISSLVTRDKIIQIGINTSSNHYIIPDDNTFRLEAGTPPEAKTLANFIISRVKPKNSFALLYSETEYSESLKNDVIQDLKGFNYSPTIVESVNPNDFDLRSTILRLKGKKIKNFAFLGQPLQMAYFVKQMREMSVNPNLIVLNATAQFDVFRETAGSSANGVFFSFAYINYNHPAAVAYKQKYDSPIPLPCVYAYEAVDIVFQALKKCDFSEDDLCLRKALFGIKDYDGVGGKRGFDDHIGDMNNEFLMYVYENGDYVPASHQ